MSSFTTEAKVGIFVLIAIILLGYMSFKIGGLELMGARKGYALDAVFDNVAGLKKKGSVQIAGIDVGTIDDITLDGARARVSMLINQGVTLPMDSRAVVRTQGVLGDKFIEIIPGTVGLPPLKAGDRIVQTAAPADLDQIINRVGQISDDIRKVTSSLGDAVGGPEGTAELKTIISNFSVMSENLAKLTEANQENLNKMIENLAAFAADVRNISESNRENINAILTTFRTTSESMNRTIAALEDITHKVNQGQGTLGALVNDDATVRDLNATLASLKNISDKINSGEGTIGRLVNDTETAEQLDEALTGVNRYLAKEEAFKVYVDYHLDYLTRLSDSRSTFNVRFQPGSDRYYMLGLVSDPWGTYDRTDKSIYINGTPTFIRQEEWSRSDFKFNAQIARRFQDLVIRGGLFESQAGIGLDYYLLDDDLRLTFEAFTGDFDRAAHLRAGLSYDFWRVFYVTAGYDDFISDRDRASPYFGLGLRFNDDDIKYVLGKVPLPTN